MNPAPGGREETGGTVVPFPGAQPAPEPEVIEAEIVKDTAAVVPVNPPPERAPVPWLRDAPVIRPVLPTWLSDPQTRREAGRWAVRYSAHWCKYHVVRTPVYAVLVAVYAPRGAGRLTRRVLAYVTDAEARPLALSAVRRDKLVS
ncbi:MAG TPA: hypothetical protein VHH34_25510 [Pseudonocardiaceae bacterium]|nr:hypothetical protein [Pseudonocardiaceae bacterium]